MLLCCCGCAISVTFSTKVCNTSSTAWTITVKDGGGATVGTGYTPSWTGAPGVYTVVYTRSGFGTRTKTYTFACGANSVTARFVNQVVIGITDRTAARDGSTPWLVCTTTVPSPDPTIVFQWGGSTLAGTLTNLGGGSWRFIPSGDPDPDTGPMSAVVTYNGKTITHVAGTSGTNYCAIPDFCFISSIGVWASGCNNSHSFPPNWPLAGATASGGGGSDTTDANGVAVVILATSADCDDGVSITVSKSRFDSYTYTDFGGCLDSVPLVPSSGYACSFCCADPLTDSLTASLSFGATLVSTTLTYVGGGSLEWEGCCTIGAFDYEWVFSPGQSACTLTVAKKTSGSGALCVDQPWVCGDPVSQANNGIGFGFSVVTCPPAFTTSKTSVIADPGFCGAAHYINGSVTATVSE